jgi:hypothetical protein
MAALMTDEVRDYVSLYFALCRCAGPQPSRGNPRTDEHDHECSYRKEVEGSDEG